MTQAGSPQAGSSTAQAAPGLTLLVAVDYSEQSERAVATARQLAHRSPSSVVHLVNVYVPPHGAQSALDRLGGESNQPTGGMLHADNELDLYCKNLQGSFPVPVIAHLRVGKKVADEIASLASEVHADLVIVGTHGRTGLGRALLGSVAESVARSAPCPVLIARDAAAPRAEEVTVEPPCPDCLAVRASSQGQRWWCDRHSQRHPRPHTYREVPEGFAYGSMLLRPGSS